MEVVYVVDLLELYAMIAGLIIVSILFLIGLVYWLWDEYLSYFFHHLKRKIKKV